mgnify:FL=1
MLAGKVVRSPHAHARIKNIEISEAAALPGVKAIVTPEDAAGIKIGINQPLLPEDTVLHVGHEVAAVAASNEQVAAQAAKLIRVEYEQLTELDSIKGAMKEGAPLLQAKAKGNVAWEVNLDHGDPDAVFAASDHVREDEYITNPSHNC